MRVFLTGVAIVLCSVQAQGTREYCLQSSERCRYGDECPTQCCTSGEFIYRLSDGSRVCREPRTNAPTRTDSPNTNTSPSHMIRPSSPSSGLSPHSAPSSSSATTDNSEDDRSFSSDAIRPSIGSATSATKPDESTSASFGSGDDEDDNQSATVGPSNPSSDQTFDQSSSSDMDVNPYAVSNVQTSKDDSGMGGGSVVAIVVGCVAAVAMLVGSVFYKKKKEPEDVDDSDVEAAPMSVEAIFNNTGPTPDNRFLTVEDQNDDGDDHYAAQNTNARVAEPRQNGASKGVFSDSMHVVNVMSLASSNEDSGGVENSKRPSSPFGRQTVRASNQTGSNEENYSFKGSEVMSSDVMGSRVKVDFANAASSSDSNGSNIGFVDSNVIAPKDNAEPLDAKSHQVAL